MEPKTVEIDVWDLLVAEQARELNYLWDQMTPEEQKPLYEMAEYEIYERVVTKAKELFQENARRAWENLTEETRQEYRMRATRALCHDYAVRHGLRSL